MDTGARHQGEGEKEGGRCGVSSSRVCEICSARHHCSAAVDPGSVVCTVNRLRYGGTHGDAVSPRQRGSYCQFCGQPLRVIGTERFCNNVRCENRFVSV